MPAPSFVPNFDQKLGHFYEDLMAHVLESSAAIQIAEKSLQIRSDIHHTLGELDFLIHTPAKLIHLEIAVKFYLAVKTPAGWHLPGPDARDNYARKLTRLRAHQLVLTKKFQEHLPEAYRIETIHPEQLIYGCIFDHIHAPEPATADFINPGCRRGRWLYKHELDQSADIRVIPKPLWPVMPEHLTHVTLEPWSEEQMEDRCTMVKIGEDPHPHFIVPRGYPDLAGP